MANDKIATLLHNAEKHIQHGKIAQAIGEYLKIVKHDPDDVLILNTVGDLYLSQGDVAEACRYFIRAAEQYAKQKALPKAITLYKKIVNAQPENLDAHLMLAELYANQGLGVDASNQWLRLSELYGTAGKSRESREAFEKAVVLDPMNASAQMQLAKMYLAEGAEQKAHLCFAAAARVQVKTGDLKSAANSYNRAVQLNPADLELMQGFLDVSLQLGDTSSVLEQIRKSLVAAPDNPSLRAMLGCAYLGTGDLKSAANEFQSLLAQDESFYLDLLRVSKAFLEAGDLELATSCIDPVLPILINRRQMEQGLEAYNLILQANPQHIRTLTKLAAAYSTACNQPRHVETLEKLAECHLKQQDPKEALKCIEEILQSQPDSEKHLAKHRQVFAAAFPGIPYNRPEITSDSIDQEIPVAEESSRDQDTSDEAFVEIDLLLNYGATEKAIEQLVSLASRDPWNKEVHRKLLSLYKEARRHDKAAEQCLMLASLHRRDGDKPSAQTFLAEARKLAPGLVGPGFDLDDFARRHGIIVEEARSKREPASKRFPQEAGDKKIASAVRSNSVEDQLHQVDFFVRLGFYEEAQAKLDELVKEHPGNPALGLRHQMLRSTRH